MSNIKDQIPSTPPRRLGCIVPSINVTAEDEIIAMAPPGVGVHFARALVDRSLPLESQFSTMVDQLPELASGLAQAGVSVIAFACTSAGFFKGAESDRDVAKAIARGADLPGVPTATAVIEALTALGVRKVAVATPYVKWVFEREREFLEAAGFVVTAITGLERTGGADISGIPQETVRSLIDSVNSADADAVFVSCTDLPAVHLITELEDRLGKPVVTSNQATFWACARRMGLRPMDRFGRLMQHLP